MERKRFSIALTCALLLAMVAGCQKQQDATQAPSTLPPTQNADSAPQKAEPDPSQNPASPLFGWVRLSPPGGNFSILLPGRPQEQEEKTKQTDLGPIQLHLFITETGLHYAYGAAYCDLPRVSDPKKFLEKIEEVILKKDNGEIVSGKDIQVENYPAGEYEIIFHDKPKFSGTARLVMVGQRVYEMAMVYYTADPNPEVRDAFFNSFTLR